jgi:hypothetical protein
MLQTHEEIPAQSTILNSQKEPEVVSNGAMGVWAIETIKLVRGDCGYMGGVVVLEVGV